MTTKSVANNPDKMFLSLGQQIAVAKDEFNNLCKASNSNATISLTSIKSMPMLISVLQSDKPDVMPLQKKLSRLLYLQFRDFIGNMKENLESQGELLSTLHDLYKFKDSSQFTGERKIHPFRTTVCQIMIFINFAIVSTFSHEEKLAKLSQLIDSAKRQIFKIKDKHPDCLVQNDKIDKFLMFLQLHSIKKSCFKKVLLITTLSVVAVALISFLIYYNRGAIKHKFTELSSWCWGIVLDPLNEKINAINLPPELKIQLTTLNQTLNNLSKPLAEIATPENIKRILAISQEAVKIAAQMNQGQETMKNVVEALRQLNDMTGKIGPAAQQINAIVTNITPLLVQQGGVLASNVQTTTTTTTSAATSAAAIQATIAAASALVAEINKVLASADNLFEKPKFGSVLDLVTKVINFKFASSKSKT